MTVAATGMAHGLTLIVNPSSHVAFEAYNSFYLAVARKALISQREKEIGRRLRHLRSALGLTQERFARRAGIERPLLAQYELGLTPVSWRAADFLCKTFHLSAHWLATGAGPTEPYLRPTTLPDQSELTGKSFLAVYEEHFAGRVELPKKETGTKSGSRIGIHIRPTKTDSSYEAFLAILEQLDLLFLEVKNIEDRRAFANELFDVYGTYLAKMYSEKTIPSLHLRETRDK